MDRQDFGTFFPLSIRVELSFNSNHCQTPTPFLTCISLSVRPDHCVVIKGPGSVSAGGSALTPPGKDRGGPSASTPTSGKDRRPKGSFGATERAPVSAQGGRATPIGLLVDLPEKALPHVELKRLSHTRCFLGNPHQFRAGGSNEVW